MHESGQYGGSLVVTNVNIRPVAGGAVGRGSIVVRNGRISEIRGDADVDAAKERDRRGAVRSQAAIERPSRETETGVPVIDGTDCTAIPGLVDTHVHLSLPGDLSFDRAMASHPSELALRAPANALRTLQAGATTVRDAGEIHGIVTSMRRLVDQRMLVAPRIVGSGQVIVMTGGHGYFLGREADGVDEVRKATREQLKGGADWVKLMGSAGFAKTDERAKSPQLDLDELRVAVREGEKAGKPTMAHAHPAVAIKDAVRAGVRSVEHCSFPDDEAIELMLEHDVTMVPTFTVYWEMMRASDSTVPKAVVTAVEAAWEEKLSCFQAALAAGVRVACGTDSGPPSAPHGNVARELQLLVEAGMSPERALETATLESARLLGLEHAIGTIEVGKQADFVLLGGDPIEDVASYRRVELVVKDGFVVTRSKR